MLLQQLRISSQELKTSEGVTKIAQDEYIHSLKPYLGLSQGKTIEVDECNKEYKFSVQNSGQTPAFANVIKLVWRRKRDN